MSMGVPTQTLILVDWIEERLGARLNYLALVFSLVLVMLPVLSFATESVEPWSIESAVLIITFFVGFWGLGYSLRNYWRRL